MGKATDKTKCKICGAAHRGPCFQRSAAEAVTASAKTKPKPVGTIAHVDHGKTALTAAIAKIIKDTRTHGKGAFVIDEKGEVQHVDLANLVPPVPEHGPNQVSLATFDKRAYQREYMRKRRAAARAAKENPSK